MLPDDGSSQDVLPVMNIVAMRNNVVLFSETLLLVYRPSINEVISPLPKRPLPKNAFTSVKKMAQQVGKYIRDNLVLEVPWTIEVRQPDDTSVSDVVVVRSDNFRTYAKAILTAGFLSSCRKYSPNNPFFTA